MREAGRAGTGANRCGKRRGLVPPQGSVSRVQDGAFVARGIVVLRWTAGLQTLKLQLLLANHLQKPVLWGPG